MGRDQAHRRGDRLLGRGPPHLAAPGRTDAGKRPGLTTDERARLATLERENKELKRANEILRKASAYFAMAELDRPMR